VDTLKRLAAIILLCLIMTGGCAAEPPKVDTPPGDLQNEKLRQEIRQLQLANGDAESFWHAALAQLPWFTVILGVITLGLGWQKQMTDQKIQRREYLDQQERDRQTKVETDFTRTVGNLGADSESLQAGAAALLPVYIRDRDTVPNSLLLPVIVANLRVTRTPVVRDLLLKALREYIHQANALEPEQVYEVDLSGADLTGLALTGLSTQNFTFTLRECKIWKGRMAGLELWKLSAERADFSEASFRDANLGQAKLTHLIAHEAAFDGARMMSAELRGSDLRHSTFRNCSLQSAHFDKADLRGCRFENSNLSDTYFNDTRLDPEVIRSIRKTSSWQRAHFDQSVKASLQAISVATP
jgi:uncharacterized protein YjbI with pentapeptide repeats